MDKSRRDFLKATGLVALGTGGGLAYLRGRTATSQEHGQVSAESTEQWAMVIDVERVQNLDLRVACANACTRAHAVPAYTDDEVTEPAYEGVDPIEDPEEHIRWIWRETYASAFPDQVHTHTSAAVRDANVLVMCNHCSDPACVRVCPTQATWKRETDGIVMMDMHRCIGCRYCMAACPYGARSFNWLDPRLHLPEELETTFPTRTRGVVEKCNFCAERLREGLQPACVEAANSTPGGEGALVFGKILADHEVVDPSNPEHEATRLLRERHTICRKVGAGTEPNVYYIV